MSIFQILLISKKNLAETTTTLDFNISTLNILHLHVWRGSLLVTDWRKTHLMPDDDDDDDIEAWDE